MGGLGLGGARLTVPAQAILHGIVGRRGCGVGGDGPAGWIGEQLADELGVQRMSSFVGFDAGQKREAYQG